MKKITSSIKKRQSALSSLYNKLNKATINKACVKKMESDSNVQNDLSLITRIVQMGNGEKFQALMAGDISLYSSPSEADLAFCSFLSKVTDSPDTIDRFLRNSGLMREKWDKRVGNQTYGEKTIAKVLSNPNRNFGETTAKETPQIKIAQGVINQLGAGNVFCLGKQFWEWKDKKGIWEEIPDEEIKKLIHETAHKGNLTQSHVSSILSLIKTEAHSTKNPFSMTPKSTINCKNGELHYENGEWDLRPFSRKSYFIHQIPVKYDEKATCKRFQRFLDEIFAPDSDKKEKKYLLQEFMGYALLASCNFERFLMLVGNGANGKSVILSVITALLGPKNVAAIQPSQFEDRFTLAHLQGKLANIITEIPQGAVIADAKLKSLVSGERMTVQHKWGKPFDLEPYATLFFATNHLPHTKDFSSAFFRRAEILTFNVQFRGEDCDTTLKDDLPRQELPGILNFALAGLKRLFDNGDFTKVQCSLDTKVEWERAADQVKAFVDEECELKPSAKISITKLYERYMVWAEENGLKSSVNRHNLSARLERFNCQRGRGSNGVRLVRGIKLKSS